MGKPSKTFTSIPWSASSSTPACRLLDAQEVAAMLNVSPAWLRDHAGRKQPKLPVVRLGSLLRFRREDILQWIDDMQKLAA
jgi:predicted DNA-binding transcriptional regulator AlpA